MEAMRWKATSRRHGVPVLWLWIPRATRSTWRLQNLALRPKGRSAPASSLEHSRSWCTRRQSRSSSDTGRICYVGRMRRGIGIDFGTTNSAVAVADHNAHVTTEQFGRDGRELDTFRSILYFAAAEKGSGKRMLSYAGPEAIEHYIHSDHNGRLIQSIKSYLSDHSLRTTSLFGKNYRFEELVGYLLRSLKTEVSPVLDDAPGKVVVGRPVRFVGSKNAEDDEFALTRLREALALAGIHEVEFELEPVAAAYSYEARLPKNELL